jgi:hypothetical protein
MTQQQNANRLFLLLGLGTLDLRRTPESLLPVLALLALLSACTLDLGGESDADQSVVRLELLHGLGGVIDEGEAGGLAATELCAKAEDADLLLVGLVETGELLPELLLRDVGAARVEDVNDHLLAAEQRVANELAGAQSDGGVGVGHLRGWMASLSCEVDDQDWRLCLVSIFLCGG